MKCLVRLYDLRLGWLGHVPALGVSGSFDDFLTSYRQVVSSKVMMY